MHCHWLFWREKSAAFTLHSLPLPAPPTPPQLPPGGPTGPVPIGPGPIVPIVPVPPQLPPGGSGGNWGGGGGCYNSFSADTPVATEEGAVPISQIEIGDQVLAYNEQTGEVAEYTVTDTISHLDRVIVHVTIDGELLETTPEHPFYTIEGEWVEAENLEVGDQIRNLDGKYGEVEAVVTLYVFQRMYNLTVDEAHTFFVGDGDWLVHNIEECVWTRRELTYGDGWYRDGVYRFVDRLNNNLQYFGEGQLGVRLHEHLIHKRIHSWTEAEWYAFPLDWPGRFGTTMKFLTQVAERSLMFNYTLQDNPPGIRPSDWNYSRLANHQWRLQGPSRLRELQRFFNFDARTGTWSAPNGWPDEFTPRDSRYFSRIGR